MIPKFRVWDKHKKQMIEWIDLDLSKDSGEDDITVFEPTGVVKDAFLMPVFLQSTGLKDKNGMEIYEGDILKGPMDFGPAGYVESVAPVSYHKINGYQLHYFLLERTEVIGNVYEDKNIKFGIVEE